MSAPTSKAEAKRQIAALLEAQDPYGPVPTDVQQQVHELARVAYPNGIPLPRITTRRNP